MKRRGFLAGLLSLFAAPELPTVKGPEYFVGIPQRVHAAKEKKAKS